MTLRDYGRIGQFMLDGGVARGKRILPAWWIGQATTPQITNGAPAPGYGYFWWMRPEGSYEAVGIFGQSITTFRDERLIIVTNSAWPRATGRDLSAARAAMVAALRPVFGDEADLTFSYPRGLVEVSPAGVTKATGLAEVAQRHGVTAADVVAFGDMPNDLEMLNWAGLGIAMGNAHPDVLAIAGEVGPHHHEDGVAQILERWF